MSTPPPSPKWSQDQQQNVSSTAYLAKMDFRSSDTASSIENVWRSALAQWNSPRRTSLAHKENPKSLPQWSGQITTPSEMDKESVLKEPNPAELPKRAYQRRNTTYTRTEDLLKFDSKKPSLARMALPKSLDLHKSHSECSSSQVTTSSKINKESVLIEPTTVKPLKRTSKRRNTTYTRSEDSLKFDFKTELPPQWRSQMITRSQMNKELVLKEPTTAELPKRVPKRRKTIYTQAEDVSNFESKEPKAKKPMKRCGQHSIITLPGEVVKKPEDNLTPDQKQLAADAAYWVDHLCCLSQMVGGQSMFLRVLDLFNTTNTN